MMKTFEEKLFDYTFKDVSLHKIYIRKMHNHNIHKEQLSCNVGEICISNNDGLPHNLVVYYATDSINYRGETSVSVAFSRLGDFMHASQYTFYEQIWLIDFCNINRAKKAIGHSILKLVDKHIVKNGSAWLEIWRHQFCSNKPLFRCTSMDCLKIDIDLDSPSN